MPNEKTLYLIKYTDENGQSYLNHYHTDIAGIDYDKYVKTMERYGLLIWEGFDE